MRMCGSLLVYSWQVAANYLPNCSSIWIVDRMCRATTNAVAKELLGEQFKRQLLMDGQYGNVTYICSATDECNPKELWTQLAEFAGEEPGRREQLQCIFDQLDHAQSEFNEQSNEEESRVERLDQLAQRMEESKKTAKKCKKGFLQQHSTMAFRGSVVILRPKLIKK